MLRNMSTTRQLNSLRATYGLIKHPPRITMSVLLANILHLFKPLGNQDLLRRIRESAGAGTRSAPCRLLEQRG